MDYRPPPRNFVLPTPHQSSTPSPPFEIHAAKRQRVSLLSHSPSPQKEDVHSTELGKMIIRDVNYLSHKNFVDLVRTRQGRGDITDLRRIHHPARQLLHKLAKSGAPVILKTKPWSSARIESAVRRGPHKSAYEYQEFLVEEMTDMIKKAFWLVLPYDKIKDLPNLRIAPLGVVPQRGRRPRPIVDYSFHQLNEDTLQLSPAEAMQFGRTLERLITQVVRADPRFGPVQFFKIDIADGFYRVWVRAQDVPKLGVAFPSLNADQPLVAFPIVLPMGWTESPPYFCTVTETITDIANERILKWRRVQPHRLDKLASTPADLKALRTQQPLHRTTPIPIERDPHLPTNSRRLAAIDVFVDDFVGIAQGDTRRLNYVRRVLLHAIDDVLRPLDPQDDPSRREPVSVKKLQQGDASWSTIKTVLGWIIDSVAMTITLPQHRLERLSEILASIPLTQKRLSMDKWYKLLGELRSMALAIPGARGLFSHLQAAIKTKTDGRLRLSKGFHSALQDFRWLESDLANRPTRLQEIVPTAPTLIGAHDASGKGAGGVWFPGPTAQPRATKLTYLKQSGRLAKAKLVDQHPIVWRYHFPRSVQDRLITFDNPHGSYGISELELAGSVLHSDVAAQCFDIRERTTKSSTDNFATMYWTRKGSTTTTTPTAPLLRLQALHQRYHRYVQLKDFVSGIHNPLADDSSRLFHLSDSQLLHYFNTTYPQRRSWRLYHPTPEMLSAVITALRNKTSKPASFLLEPKEPRDIGRPGSASAKSSESIQLFKSSKIPSLSSKSSSAAIASETLPPANAKSDLAQWKMPYAALAKRLPLWGPRTHVLTFKAT